MKVGEVPQGALGRFLKDAGIGFRTGPFQVRVISDVPQFGAAFRLLYSSAVFSLEEEVIHDFHVRLSRPRGLRRHWRPQVHFHLDDEQPLEPFPLDHAFPLFEWGLNFSIATRAHQYCLLHSAVIERNGRALVMPAMPGSGKSTLCAALMFRGWRLLSDEFGILEPESGQLLPMPRVIPLKNRSIEVIRDFAPEAVMGPLFPRTRKGDVAHVAPTPESLERQDEKVRPAWIVFPRYQPGVRTHLEPVPGIQAFVRLSNNSFNYHLLGETAYRGLTAMVRGCECYSFHYSNLDEATEVMDELAR